MEDTQTGEKATAETNVWQRYSNGNHQDVNKSLKHSDEARAKIRKYVVIHGKLQLEGTSKLSWEIFLKVLFASTSKCTKRRFFLHVINVMICKHHRFRVERYDHYDCHDLCYTLLQTMISSHELLIMFQLKAHGLNTV